MRLFILLAAACLFSCPTIAQTQNQRPDNKAAAKQAPWPLQLEMRVPFEPTAFPSGQHVYLMYELHLTNFMPMPVSLSRIEVLDADAGTSKPIATFETAQLETMLQPLGGKALSDPKRQAGYRRWPERHRLYVNSVRPRLTYSRQTASSREHGYDSEKKARSFPHITLSCTCSGRR